MRDVPDGIYPLTSAIIMFCKTHGISCATRDKLFPENNFGSPSEKLDEKEK